ncbi:MAG: NAD+ synthase [Bacteroidetes bacterium]|jgi:NAD+ synthase (glutamine-hydrolysing)|nr:NAD+ synthase [Bacteroidota bacterium]
MKIALSQLNYHVGNFTFNTARILEEIKRAETEQVDLLVFAELAICGYPPLDFLDYSHFIDRCRESIDSIAGHCTQLTVIVGGPAFNPDPKGKNLFNSAYVLAKGTIQQIVHKTLLPTYDVFDEYRWFESNREFNCIEVNNVRIALTVCEDLWNMDDDPLYTFWPMKELIRQKPELMINIAASPFSGRHAEDRKAILQKNVKEFKLPLLYVNQVGGQTDILFDGGSLVYNADGSLLQELNYFHEDYFSCTFDTASKSFTPLPVEEKSPLPADRIGRIYEALVMGIRDYFKKMGFSKATLGLSGGIDSAVVLALAADALGAKNVHAVLMPSEFSSDHSVSDSLKMAEIIGCSQEIIPIAPMYNSFLDALKKDFEGLPFNVAEENIQARVRGVTLMALSNKLGFILLNTSNKSELAVGYGTLYGDMCGGLSVIGDLYKMDVYALANFINREKEIIPVNIITKPPSAELRPGQKDSDSLPPYETLDAILFRYIEEHKGPDKIIKEGFDEALVYRVLKMVNNNEWKRHQFAPILRISRKAFGRGRRMPLVAKYLG